MKRISPETQAERQRLNAKGLFLSEQKVERFSRIKNISWLGTLIHHGKSEAIQISHCCGKTKPAYHGSKAEEGGGGLAALNLTIE